MIDINSALMSLSLSLEQLAKNVTGVPGTGVTITNVADGAPIERSKMFEAIMGCSEERFKEILGVAKGPDMNKCRDVVHTRPANFSALAGSKFLPDKCWENFGAPRVGKLFSKMGKGKSKGKLFILLKSQGKEEADIRWLQKQFPGAVFQIASTFACLEGGAIEFASELNEMSESPVQGEDAVLAAITGAIIRKYLVPLRTSRDLLRHVRHFFTFPYDANFTQDSQASSRNYFRIQGLSKHIASDDLDFIENNVCVGMHQNVLVTSGPLDPEILTSRINSKGEEIKFPAFDSRLSKPHTVHQVFTAALDLNTSHKPKVQAKALIASQVPQAVLRGMYKGTIAAAWDILIRKEGKSGSATSLTDFLNPHKQMPRLFLTMVGTGAFDNKTEWVVKILAELKPMIEKSGLQVCIVVWDTGNKQWVKDLMNLASS